MNGVRQLLENRPEHSVALLEGFSEASSAAAALAATLSWQNTKQYKCYD